MCVHNGSSLEAAPISFPASETWYVALTAGGLLQPPSINGNDGPWSSFGMQVGTPGQNLRLIPSNSGNAVWPVLPQGCIIEIQIIAVILVDIFSYLTLLRLEIILDFMV